MKKRFAALWRRVVAYIIDVFVVSFIVIAPFSAKMGESIEIESFAGFFDALEASFTTEMILAGVIMALLTLLYWTFLEWKFQQTVGKILLRIKVAKKITFAQAVVRNVTKLSTVILVLDVLYMLFTRGHQRYFEKLSKTEVVDEVVKRRGFF